MPLDFEGTTMKLRESIFLLGFLCMSEADTGLPENQGLGPATRVSCPG